MSEHDEALRVAEARVCEAKTTLETFERQHAVAAREWRSATDYANATSRDDAALYARRLREANIAFARVTELEQRVADAREEVESAEKKVEAPRAAMRNDAASELNTLLAEVRSAMARAVAGMAETVAAVIALRRALSRASVVARRMGGSSSYTEVEVGAHEVLRSCSKLRPEGLVASELVRGFEQELHARGVAERIAGLHRVFRDVV
jgi:multidrug resistance efflux pump